MADLPHNVGRDRRGVKEDGLGEPREFGAPMAAALEIKL
jgi:hypothetical protein